MGLCNMKHITSHFPLSPAELGLQLWWCQGLVRIFFHLWSRLRTGSEAQALVWPAESTSLALECVKERAQKGWEGGWGERMVELGCCAGGKAAATALSACAVWVFTQWSSVIRSHLHTYTKGCVIEQVMWGWIRGLEDWVYKESWATFLFFFRFALCYS